MGTIKTDTIEDLSAGESIDATYLVHGTAKAWSHYDQGAGVTVNDSFNISSITDSGTGYAANNLTNAMSSANFMTAGNNASQYHTQIWGTATGSFTIYTFNSSHTAVDCSSISGLALGDLA